MPPSDRTSAQSHQRLAAATGTAPPAVEYGLGVSGVSQSSTRRVNTPPPVTRPRPPLAIDTLPAHAASPAPTVYIPFDRDLAEPVGTTLLRLPSLPRVPSFTTAGLDTLGAAAELKLGDSAASYSHADWARERQAESACHAAMRYIILGLPQAPSADFLSRFSWNRRPFFLKADCKPPTTASFCSSANRLCSPSAGSQRPMGCAANLMNGESVRMYVALLMGTWAMQA